MIGSLPKSAPNTLPGGTDEKCGLTGRTRLNAWQPPDHKNRASHRWCLALAGLLAAASAVSQADELITMSNGMTCWRDATGHTYGCSGGVNTGDSGFNDTRTGQRYERIDPNQSLDTRTGQAFPVPGQQPRGNGQADEW
jgi:hypothetical protein